MRRPVVRLTAPPDPGGLLVAWVREFDEATAQTFARDVAAIRQARQPVCPVIIDSPGGDAYALLGMMDMLASVEVPVVTVAVGKAMSCGAALFSCGTMRYVAPNATLMLHDVSCDPVDGKAEEQRVNMVETERVNALLWRRIARNLGKPPTALLDEHVRRGRVDWYLPARAALDLGLATHLGVPVFEVRHRLDPLLTADR